MTDYRSPQPERSLDILRHELYGLLDAAESDISAVPHLQERLDELSSTLLLPEVVFNLVESMRDKLDSLLKRAFLYDPSKWQSIAWSSVSPGQEVYLQGTHEGKFRAYGPHKVHDPTRRELESGTPKMAGRVFVHWPQELIKQVEEEDE